MQPTRNARGGINKTSRREELGQVASGATGITSMAQLPQLTNPINTVPSVTASEIITKPSSIDLSGTFEAPKYSNNAGVVSNVSNSIAERQKAFDEAQKTAQEQESTFAALGLGSSADTRASLNEQFGLPENMKELQDIQLQLSDMQTSSDLTKSRIENAAGQTLGQAGREVTQEDREFAIRSAGLAARASVLQGNIETARTLVNDMMNDVYADRQVKLNIASKQLDRAYDVADEKEKQLIDERRRVIEEEKARIKEVKDAVNQAIITGGASQQEIAQLTDTSKTDEERLVLAQAILARVAGEDRQFTQDSNRLDLAIKGAQFNKLTAPDSGGAPELKNFGTADNPLWKQFNPSTGAWEDVAGLDTFGGAIDPQTYSESQNKLDSLLNYSNQAMELSSAAGASGISKTIGAMFVGDTKFKRLENVVDTMKTNLLTLNTDPSIKKFFGPQMSNRDTELMVSAGTTLNAERQSPSDLQNEITQYQGFIKRAKGWTYLGNGGVLTVTLKDPSSGQSQQVTVDYQSLAQAVKDGVEVSF